MKGLKPLRVDGGLLTTRWIVRRFESSTECGFLCYYCSMGVVGAVLNADSVDSTAPTSKSKLRGKLFP